ncbi:uncharacterized protein LOC111632386 [Centruroides sculpturatus]|uniref:uncharacterized protein LOC111632386 n=1 Tax=Centruroides sculpturatus TaxID=218467 RepID=UPI000C6D6C7B|nr:uncharacterized protein LOC111632386 [Centruroides sculpturatus]
MNYAKLWISEFQIENDKLQESLSKKLFMEISSSESLKTIYFQSKLSDISLYEKKFNKNFKRFMKNLENWEELLSVIRQIIFYITMEIQQNDIIAEETVLLHLNFLNTIIHSYNQKETANNINDLDHISSSKLLKEILGNSSVVYWFLAKEYNCLKLSKELSSHLTSFILNLISLTNEFSQLDKEVILKSYKCKMISWIQMNRNDLIKKKFILKNITFETLISDFLPILCPNEAENILQVITEFDLSQIQKIDPAFSVFAKLVKCCLNDKNIDLMKSSNFKTLYFLLMSSNLEKNKMDEFINYALEMIQIHPSSFSSVDIVQNNFLHIIKCPDSKVPNKTLVKRLVTKFIHIPLTRSTKDPCSV